MTQLPRSAGGMLRKRAQKCARRRAAGCNNDNLAHASLPFSPGNV